MNKIKEFPHTDVKEEHAAENPNFGIIGGVVAVLLLAVAGFSYLDFSQQRILAKNDTEESIKQDRKS